MRASAAYRRMRRDDYPRGDPRELIKQWRIRTRAELGDAESDFAELSEAASWKIDVEDALEACDAPEPAPE